MNETELLSSIPISPDGSMASDGWLMKSHVIYFFVAAWHGAWDRRPLPEIDECDRIRCMILKRMNLR